MLYETQHLELVREIRGDEAYEYYPLGDYVVVAPGVCGGRPTFKGTRLEVQRILDLVASGWTMERITTEYHHSGLTVEAVSEAVRLAGVALERQAGALAA